MRFRRWAVYHTPKPGALADFGAAWLGWDIAKGEIPPPINIPNLSRPREELTSGPRRYGFHATLKPPFNPARDVEADDIGHAVEGLAKRVAPVRINSLTMSRMGRFLALTAPRDSEALGELAERCLVDLDHLRASPSGEELARRRAVGLSERQEELLARWGYPYVLEGFRFHMTLTGNLDPGETAAVETALSNALGPLHSLSCDVEDLVLAGEAEDGMFREFRRFPLSG